MKRYRITLILGILTLVVGAIYFVAMSYTFAQLFTFLEPTETGTMELAGPAFLVLLVATIIAGWKKL
jgi:hypothetical protein